MSGTRVIPDDAAYERARIAILDMADKLDDPLLLSADEHKRMMMIYDRTTDLMHFYRRGELVQLFPGLREQYTVLGLRWQELGEPVQSTDPEPVAGEPPQPLPPEPIHVPEPERPKQEPIKKPAANLMSWLDD